MTSRMAPGLFIIALLAVPALGQDGNQLAFANTTARPGELRTLNLDGTFASPVSGLVVTVLFDPGVIQVQSVSLSPLTQGFALRSTVTGGRLTLAMAAANGITASSPEPIVRLAVRVIGGPGSITTLDIASAVINEGAVAAAIADGWLRVVREARVTGWVVYYANLQPVPEVVLTATGTATVSNVTDATGRFVLGPMEVGDYTVAISRQGAPAAVDALDAAEILRTLIGAIQLSEGQAWVADVSGNGGLGTTDAALILRLLVGLEQGFPAGPFWRFRPAQLRFQPLIQDEFRNVTAYLLGDVDGSWAPAPPSAKPLAAASPRLLLAAAPARAGRRAAVILSGESLSAVRGGAVEVRYDPQQLTATGVTRLGLGEAFLMAANTGQPGSVRVAFAGAEGLEGNADLLRIDFTEIGAPGAVTRIAIQAARLNHFDLPPSALDSEDYALGKRVADLDGDGRVDLTDFFLLVDHLGKADPGFDLDGSGQVDIGDLFLLFDHLAPGARSKAALVAAQRGVPLAPSLEPNAPNPFNSSTAIGFALAADGLVELSVFDATGQRVRRLAQGWHVAGAHTAHWDGRDDAGRRVASGPYLCQLRAAGQVLERKLLLLR